MAEPTTPVPTAEAAPTTEPGLDGLAPAPAPGHRRFVGAGPRWTALVLGLLTLATRLPGLVSARAFNPDEATLAVGGRTLLDGGSLYVDLIDRKPPLPFAAYAAVFGITGSEDLRWLRLLVVVLVWATALLVSSEAVRRWGPRAGLPAGIALVIGAAALGPSDAQAANFELFALLPMTAAVVLAARRRTWAAGACLAVAVLCKQPAAVAALPVAFSLWRTRGWRGLLQGGLTGAVAGLALAAPFGVGRVIDWSLLGTGGYLKVNLRDTGFVARRLGESLFLALGVWGGFAVLVAAPGQAHLRGVRERIGGHRWRPLGWIGEWRERRPGRSDLDIWLFLAVSALGIVAGLRFFPHYLIQVLPALCLLAGRGVARQPRWLWVTGAWTIIAGLITAGLAWNLVVASPPSLERSLADAARSRTAPGDEILVWGNVPEVYWLADRQPAGGFTHTEFITGYSGGRRPVPLSDATVSDPELYRDWLRRLEAHPPELVFDTSAAGVRGGYWYPADRFGAFDDWLQAGYVHVATVDDVPVYRRRG